jgi:hypothetical protein
MKSYWTRVTLAAIFAAAASVVSAQSAEPAEKPAEESGEEAGGIGLTVGLEAGFGDVVDEAVFSLTPNVVYENSFGDFDVFAEIDYTAGFGDPAEHGLYIEEEIGYNIGLIENGTLSIILNNSNEIRLEPELEDGETHVGTFQPSLKWTQGLDFGDLWLQAGLPIGYLTGIEDETTLGLSTTVGWDSTFGLGVEFALDFTLDPESDLAGYGLKLSYDGGLISGEIGFAADKEFKVFGVNPEIDVNLDALTIYAKAEIIKIDGFDDPQITPAVGVTYSF